jgi:hypothetical protein
MDVLHTPDLIQADCGPELAERVLLWKPAESC